MCLSSAKKIAIIILSLKSGSEQLVSHFVHICYLVHICSEIIVHIAVMTFSTRVICLLVEFVLKCLDSVPQGRR